MNAIADVSGILHGFNLAKAAVETFENSTDAAAIVAHLDSLESALRQLQRRTQSISRDASQAHVTARQIGYSLERFILRKANVTRTHGRHSSREVQSALRSLAPDQLLRLSQHVEQNFTSRFRGAFNIFANIPAISNIARHVRPSFGRPANGDRSNNGRTGLGAFGRGANGNGFARGPNNGQVAQNVPAAQVNPPVAASGMYEEGDFAVDDFSDYALGEEDYVEGDFATDAGDDEFADFAIDDFSDEEGDFAISESDLALDEVDYALDGDFAIEEEEGTAAFDESEEESFAHAGEEEEFGDFAEGDLVDESFEAVGEFATEEVDTFEAVDGDLALDEYFAVQDPSAPATSDALPGWAIGLVVVGILVFIAMIVVAIQVILYVRMK